MPNLSVHRPEMTCFRTPLRSLIVRNHWVTPMRTPWDHSDSFRGLPLKFSFFDFSWTCKTNLVLFMVNDLDASFEKNPRQRSSSWSGTNSGNYRAGVESFISTMEKDYTKKRTYVTFNLSSHIFFQSSLQSFNSIRNGSLLENSMTSKKVNRI